MIFVQLFPFVLCAKFHLSRTTLKSMITVIAGPNYSGKSIYVKQVGLIVFLSHIGSFVPADAATVDRIFCANGKQVHDRRAIYIYDRSTSSRQATSRSMCLLDEFGKATLTEVFFLTDFSDIDAPISHQTSDVDQSSVDTLNLLWFC